MSAPAASRTFTDSWELARAAYASAVSAPSVSLRRLLLTCRCAVAEQRRAGPGSAACCLALGCAAAGRRGAVCRLAVDIGLRPAGTPACCARFACLGSFDLPGLPSCERAQDSIGADIRPVIEEELDRSA